MIADLWEALSDAARAGDVAAARVAHEALGRLLGGPEDAAGGELVDLDERRSSCSTSQADPWRP